MWYWYSDLRKQQGWWCITLLMLYAYTWIFNPQTPSLGYLPGSDCFPLVWKRFWKVNSFVKVVYWYFLTHVGRKQRINCSLAVYVRITSLQIAWCGKSRNLSLWQNGNLRTFRHYLKGFLSDIHILILQQKWVTLLSIVDTGREREWKNVILKIF